MEGLPTLGILACAAVVVLGGIALTVVVDPAARARQRRHERFVRRATTDLLREADEALREHSR